MTELPISRCARRLTEAEKEQFQNWGYVKNLPVFDDSEIPILLKGFEDMLALLPSHIHISRVNNWHKANRWVYELSQTKAILDYVEDLIGPNILQWGAHCFAKFPGDVPKCHGIRTHSIGLCNLQELFQFGWQFSIQMNKTLQCVLLKGATVTLLNYT